MIVQGMKDIFQDETPQMTMEEANAAFQSYATSIQAKAGEKYIKEGQEFLTQNGARPEVITLPSGLQYEIIKEGTGPKPTTADKVKTHYHGTLIDGTVFDSSVDRGEPISFGVTQVIAGWTEALQLMPVGSKWKLYIPSDLAYGANPRPGGAIKPNMALIFDIELLGIE
ncbi:UNVERIFIED_CONTAM: hypothetical protein GTU68_067355 [Idotea baltica]|nr:hypothetical protein [Idotea baltica]